MYSKDDQRKSHLKFQITNGMYVHYKFTTYNSDCAANSYVNFILCFCRYKVNVTFFNEFGQSFDKALKEKLEEQVVVIIASGKVNKYDGKY